MDKEWHEAIDKFSIELEICQNGLVDVEIRLPYSHELFISHGMYWYGTNHIVRAQKITNSKPRLPKRIKE